MDWRQVDWSTQTQMLIHRQAFRTEDIGQGNRTDSMVCPLCHVKVASNSMRGHISSLGGWLAPTLVRFIEPTNPNIPPHEPWLVWRLNEHLRNVHNTTPEIETARAQANLKRAQELLDNRLGQI